MALPALAAPIPCAWQNIPVDAKIGFNNQNFPNSSTGAFLTIGFQLQVPCVMSGEFTVSVTTADTGGTTNKYAFGLYYNFRANGTVGALYATTGEFNGSVLNAVNSGRKHSGGAHSGLPCLPVYAPGWDLRVWDGDQLRAVHPHLRNAVGDQRTGELQLLLYHAEHGLLIRPPGTLVCRSDSTGARVV